MGTAKFYYYPRPDGQRLEVIDIGEGLAEFFTDMEIVASDGLGFDGSIRRTVGSIRERVTIQRDRMRLSEELAHKFRALQNHLDRGYPVAFSADSEKTFAGFLTTQQISGDTVINVGGNPFYNMTTNNGLLAGDYITIETANPGLVTETKKVDSLSVPTFSSGGTVTASTGPVYRWDLRGHNGRQWESLRGWPAHNGGNEQPI
jgi:hypothetical protein